MKTEIFADYSAFVNRTDKDTNGVTQSFADEHPNYVAENTTNTACFNLTGCSNCTDCSRCSGCSGCTDCTRCTDCTGCSRSYGCTRCYDCYAQINQRDLKNNKPAKAEGRA
jgi:hypothetical protein